MAEEKRQPMVYKPRFLLLCMYIMCYITLRSYGDIVSQVTDSRVQNVITRQIIVGSDPTLPTWQRQLYRAVFAPCMVVEEEAKRLADQGKGMVHEASN